MSRVWHSAWFQSLVPLALVLVAYFCWPVKTHLTTEQVLLRLIPTVLAVGGIAFLVAREVRGVVTKRDMRPVHLVLLLELVVIVFSLTYFLIARNEPTQFVGLETRLDALYFTVTTTATVGFGDIHAEGQLARGLVTAQMAFNVAFIAVVAGLFRTRFTERRARILGAHPDGDHDADGEATGAP